jgi:hypothetical protein
MSSSPGALLLALQSAIGTAQTAIQTAITAANAEFTANPTPPAGTAPAVAAAALTNQSAAMTQLGQLYQLNGIVNRSYTNISTAIASGSTVLT